MHLMSMFVHLVFLSAGGIVSLPVCKVFFLSEEARAWVAGTAGRALVVGENGGVLWACAHGWVLASIEVSRWRARAIAEREVRAVSS